MGCVSTMDTQILLIIVMVVLCLAAAAYGLADVADPHVNSHLVHGSIPGARFPGFCGAPGNPFLDSDGFRSAPIPPSHGKKQTEGHKYKSGSSRRRTSMATR